MNLTVIFIAIVVVAIVVVTTIIVIYKKSGFSGDSKSQEVKDALTRTQAQLESKQQELDRVYEENRDLHKKMDDLTRELGNSEANAKGKEEELKERMQSMDEWYNKMQVEFGEIAKKLMDEKESGFDKRNAEMLEPLRDSLKEMQEELRKTKVQVNVDLNAQISSLKDMNRELCNETSHLANVFKGGNGVQGRWGESQLARVLEIAGIPEGEMGYTMQVSAQNSKSAQDRPDCIVHLPGNKCIIIDAKTNLTAYERSFHAASEEKRENCLKEHAKAVKTQITNLASKKYQENKEYNNPGFVLMFSPVESAMTAAQQYSDVDLFQYAADRNISIVTPWNLIPILFVVRNIWKTEQQERNVSKIAKRGRLIYDKIYQILTKVDNINKNIGAAQKECQQLSKDLGNKDGGLMQQARQLEELGIKPMSTNKGENKIENTTVYKDYYEEDDGDDE
ncbi:MAG: DNA recombination protein RmuC [Bacteroidales bacterium]|nr:DNA recombination protein RmuC [Bacteroidales bacterium]